MAVSRPLYLGPRLRRLRRELGLTQQTMADDLGISASYVALLERNQRPLTADLLLRLARAYRLDVAELAAEDSQDYVRRIGDVLRDPIFADIDLPALEIADLANSFPGVSEALLRLHGAYTREQRVLAEQQDEGAGEHDPVAEARRFVARERNHFPSLESLAEEIGGQIGEPSGMADWLKKRGTRVRLLPPEVLMGSLRRYDRHSDQLLIADALDPASRQYQLALHIAYTGMRSEISSILRGAEWGSPTASNLVRRALGGYGAAALLMPYGKFLQSAESRGYDIGMLANLFGASFEQVAHRLTTLGRPAQEGVPFFFIRVDPAGNVSKRLDGAGFPFAQHGGGCPLWNVHSTFRTPGEIVTQWLELPDGQRFFSIARTVMSSGAWGEPRHIRAVALACAADHAPRLVYAAGVEPATALATPIGVTCRLCHRARCTARAAPPIGREILPDDYRRAPEPFTFADE
jgi:predicted transcriptional regulator/transcriptional regulator with XRE-family HTH domain